MNLRKILQLEENRLIEQQKTVKNIQSRVAEEECRFTIGDEITSTGKKGVVTSVIYSKEGEHGVRVTLYKADGERYARGRTIKGPDLKNYRLYSDYEAEKNAQTV